MKRRWQRLRRAALWLFASWLVLLVGERALQWCWPYPLAALQALPVSTVVTAADGTWLRVTATPAGERVLPLRWCDCPAAVQQAILASEDEHFFAHTGVDFRALLRAAVSNVAAGRVVSGASTLTMQVVRMVEPRSRTLWSKCLEIVRARQLERLLDKETIASTWLTQVPMGGTLRGFEAGARHWFGRPLAQLAAHEVAALVALVPAPSARAPHRRPELLRARRDTLLAKLAQRGALDAAAATAAQAQELGMGRRSWPWSAPHLCAATLASLPMAGRPPVLTTAASLGLQQRLERIAREAELPGTGLAIVVLRRRDGAIQALLGDRDPRAPLDLSRRRRAAGSTLKPFLYALAHGVGGIGPQSLLDDLPRTYDDWQPANFDRRWLGRTRAADALATSSNLVAVRCLELVGTDVFADLLQQLGLGTPGRLLHLDGALGTDAVSPLGLARAYWRFVERPESVGLQPASVDWTLAAMRRLPLVAGQSRAGDVAWKSGTSSGRRDAWCVGITTTAIAVVWLGNHDGRGLPDLVGVRSANRLLAAVVAVLGGDV
jgi:penicillin-binding protein 1C